LLQNYIPPNAGFVLSVLMDIANFNVVPTGDIYSEMFSFSETPAYRENFSYSGYETSNIILNLGTIFLGLMIFFAYVLLILILFRSLSKCTPALFRFYHRQKQSLFWNGLIRLCFEIFFDCIISAFVNVHHLMSDTFSDIFA